MTQRFVLCLVLLCAGLAPLPAQTSAATAVEHFPDASYYFHGRFVYQRNCAVCHGTFGNGKGEMAGDMFPKPRPFTSGIFKYRSTPPGFLPTNADLVKSIRSGIPGSSMPIFQGLTDRDVRAVVEYIKSFSPRWKQAENHAAPMAIPRPPEWFEDDAAFQRKAARGGELFTAVCATCHGPRGDGDGPAAASLRDDWDDPCPPANLRAGALRFGQEPKDIYRVLAAGVSGTPMPGFDEALTEDQKWELVAHIQQLRRAAGPKRRPALSNLESH